MSKAESVNLRPLVLNIDVLVRGALVVTVIDFATTIVFSEIFYVIISVNADNEWLKRLGFAHQAYAVVSAICLSAVFDLVFLPVIYFTARAYMRSHWKMMMFSSLVWAGQIAFMTYKWRTLPDPMASLPGDIINVVMLGYLALRWRQIAAQS